jgi:hypothetical protein
MIDSAITSKTGGAVSSIPRPQQEQVPRLRIAIGETNRNATLGMTVF